MSVDFDRRVSPDLKTLGEKNVADLAAWNRRRSEVRYPAATARHVRSLGIVGAGAMGTSIAVAAVDSGLRVVITDLRQEALATLRARMAAEWIGEHGRTSPQEIPGANTRLRTTTDVDEVAECDLVLETVYEDFFLKQRLLPNLEQRLAPDTVLASNTSTISIGRLAGHLTDPRRFCGIHFFLPVRHQRLIEIVVAPRVSHTTLATAVTFARSLGKIPLVVPDGPAFLVNRLMMIYFSEALQLANEGVSIERIEQVATDFGMAVGPMRLIDQIGLDVALDCGWVLAGPMEQRLVSAPLLVALVKAGRLGRKSGAGFFQYSTKDSQSVNGVSDPALAAIFRQQAADQRRYSTKTITSRLFLPILLEATRVLAEGRLDDPRDIDLAAVFGFGFPATRGGLLYWADTLGFRRILELLKPLETLGVRVHPTPFLTQMAAAGRRFYPDHLGDQVRENEDFQ